MIFVETTDMFGDAFSAAEDTSRFDSPSGNRQGNKFTF